MATFKSFLAKLIYVPHMCFQAIFLLGFLVLRIPRMLIQFGLLFCVTTWITGVLVGLIKMGKFLPLSYFDMSKYAANIQQAFLLAPGEYVWTAWNGYTTPIFILLILELGYVLFLSIHDWFLPRITINID